MKKSITTVLPTVAALALGLQTAQAFPPAPHHLLYGQVRDEFGAPINLEGAEVIFQSHDQREHKIALYPNVLPGANYRLPVPMDSGVTTDLYSATAMRPTLPFLMYVRIQGVNYLPIEVSGDFLELGEPGESTRLDLTLGEDLDGDGLPDAWERALLKAGQDLSDINPDDDTDGDGLNNLQEYISGSYAFDPEDGFDLKLIGLQGGLPVVEFVALRGRHYTMFASTDLENWERVAFQESAADAALTDDGWTDDLYSESVHPVRAVVDDNGAASVVFFKLMVQ